MFKPNYFINFLIVAGLLLLAVSCGSDSGNDNDKAVEELPDDYNLPTQLTYASTDQYIAETFYPIGWSPNGKLAYIVEPDAGETGFYLFRFAVLDTESNSVVDEWEITVDDEVEYTEQNLQTTWEENYSKFKNLLLENEIRPKEMELQPLQFTYNKNDYTVRIETQTSGPNEEGFSVVEEYSIVVEGGEAGSKTMEQTVPDNMTNAIDVKAFGVLLNPFNDMAAIVYGVERLGFGGPPSTLHLHIQGADLGNL